MGLVFNNEYLCADAIAHHAHMRPRAAALICEEETLSWAELDLALNTLANGLIAAGCSKGTRICSLLPNGLPAFLLFWATVRAGGVIVPLNPMLDDASLGRLAGASEGRLFFANLQTAPQVDRIRSALPQVAADAFFLFGGERSGWRNAELLTQSVSPGPPPVKVAATDSMTIFYSSGTTGTPKGIEHTHFSRLNYCYGFGPGLKIDRYTVAICVTPLYASGTMITMLPTIYYGGTVVLVPKFAPDVFWQTVRRVRGTHSFLVPAMYAAILQHPGTQGDLDSLRVLVSAGQTMAMATRDEIASLIPGAGIYEVYGATEGFFTIACPQDFERGKRNTVGLPGFLEDIRIVGEDHAELASGETGEIVAYGAGMMKGYADRPDLTDETIWHAPDGRTFLRSGDLGHLDEDGFLYVSGRKKDMIKSGGFNIYAADLEEVLAAHPAVGECAVVGVAHPRWTETPVGVVVLREGQAMAAGDICAWVNARLAKFQRLSRVVIREDFPRATYGKIRKDALRDEYRDIEGS